MKLLSVLIPAKNADKFLLESIKTTLRFLPENSEILLLNDGSTDRTLELAQTIKSKALRIISSDQSVGVSAGLNLLLAESSSKYIARMDADDLVVADRFVKQLRLVQKSDFVFSRLNYISENNQFLGTEKAPSLSEKVIPTHLLLGNTLAHPTLFAKREALEALGGYQSTLAEDYDLYLRAISSGFTIRKSFIPVIHYRLHDSQVTKNPSWSKQIFDEIFQTSYGLLFKEKIGFDFRPSFIDSKFISAPYMLLSNDDLSKFNQWWVDEIAKYSLPERLWLKKRKSILEKRLYTVRDQQLKVC